MTSCLGHNLTLVVSREALEAKPSWMEETWFNNFFDISVLAINMINISYSSFCNYEIYAFV